MNVGLQVESLCLYRGDGGLMRGGTGLCTQHWLWIFGEATLFSA